jgi:hypothetical protein
MITTIETVFYVPVFDWMYSILWQSIDEFDANTSRKKVIRFGRKTQNATKYEKKI